MVGLICLDDRPSGPLSATGAPDGLGQQLIRPLRGSLVGEVESHVGRHHTHQRDFGDVEAFGHQTRADQNVEAAFGEGVEDPLDGALVFRHVAVQPADPKVWEDGLDLLLHSLGPTAQISDARRAADGAARCERRRGPAVMAPQSHARLVEDERPLTFGAALDVAAVAADHDRSRTAPVDDENGAFAFRQGREGTAQGAG